MIYLTTTGIALMLIAMMTKRLQLAKAFLIAGFTVAMIPFIVTIITILGG